MQPPPPPPPQHAQQHQQNRFAAGNFFNKIVGVASKRLGQAHQEYKGIKVAATKIQNWLEPTSIVLEKITLLANWTEGANTWVVVAALSAAFVACSVLPWDLITFVLQTWFGVKFFFLGKSWVCVCGGGDVFLFCCDGWQ